MNKQLRNTIGLGIVAIPLAIVAGYFAGKSGTPNGTAERPVISEAERARRAIVCPELRAHVGTILPIHVRALLAADTMADRAELMELYATDVTLPKGDEYRATREDYERATRAVFMDLKPYEAFKTVSELSPLVTQVGMDGCLNG